MPEKIYWGNGGQFGPFDRQADGWPDAGQVMRYFRERAGITAKVFGKIYGKEARPDGKPVCERWILEMELENKVPCDITRRRIIARLLHIPPELLGLAALSDVTFQLTDEQVPFQMSTREKLTKNADISLLKKKICTALRFHLTSHAQDLLVDIEVDRKCLALLANQAKGDLLHQIKELLIANDLLAAKILRDQAHYPGAYAYANHALLEAESIDDDELSATACYTRGCITLQWGQFGQFKQGRFQIDKNKIKEATYDFQTVLNKEPSRRIMLHPQLRGFILLQLGRALSLLQEKYSTQQVLKLIDRAASTVERNPLDDLYTRVLVTGTLSGLHQGGYYLTRADILTLAGLPDEAMQELNQLSRLVKQTYGKDETRNQAWNSIVQAKALMGLREYAEATNKIREALIVCHGIQSTQNIAVVADIYGRLTSGPYRHSGDVKDLEEILQEWY